MGGDSMKTKIFILNGRLEHVGLWDYQIKEIEHIDNPWLIHDQPCPVDWDFCRWIEEVVTNPLPEGVIELEAEIEETAKGRLVLASDWYTLREDAYPPLKDQLDAMWKGGEAAQEMAALVQSIKDRYPKTEAS